MSEAVLSIRGLVRRYVTGADQISVLQGVDLDVMAGEIVGLVGPSGSGKSSLLQAAGLLERPDAGRICILGRDCSELPDRKPDAQARAKDLLSQMGLAERVGHQPAQLSGGEQQRVAVARALANSPRLLLADEPTGNLDPATSAAVFDNLQTLVRQTGVAALIATHNLDLAKHMDRVFTLKDGRLQAQT